MKYLHRIPRLFVRNGRPFWWYLPGPEQAIALTFDDGPHPDITPWVLDLLDAHSAAAFFFLIGKNVRKYPATARLIVERGHGIGNHTHTHPRGSHTPLKAYMREVATAQETIKDITGVNPGLFRPPYGSLTRKQIRALVPDFRLVMMDVIPGDFDVALSPSQCLRRTLGACRPGSIILFHDSEKALPRLRAALPELLKSPEFKGSFCSLAAKLPAV